VISVDGVSWEHQPQANHDRRLTVQLGRLN